MVSFTKFRINCGLTMCLFAVAGGPLSLLALSGDASTVASRSGSSTPSAELTPADYVHSDFTVEDGLPDNVVNAIVETENGLLWVGTDAGLASFDGREFDPITLQIASAPAQGGVHTLLKSSTGDLWVGTDAGVVRIPKAALNQFSPALVTYFRLGTAPSNEVDALLQTLDGALWAGTSHGLYREDSGKFLEVIAGIAVSRVSEAQDGHLFVISDGKLIEWDGRRIVPHPDLAASLGVHDGEINDVFQDRDGTIWYATQQGMIRRGQRPLPRLQPLSASTTASYRRPYPDSEGHLWVVNGIGVFRVTGDVMEDNPLPLILPRCFYADREGGFWVGTNGNGLIHLKRRIVRMFTTSDGLISDIPMAVLSSRDGTLWVGCNCGLSAYDGKHFKSYREKDGLTNSCVWSLAEDPNRDLWIGTYGGGLFRFRDGRFVQYSKDQGLVSNVVLQVIVVQDGSLWIATPEGISHMENGHIRNYTTADGLSSNQVTTVHQDHSGTIWAATQGGIDRLVAGRFVAFPSARSNSGSFSIRFTEDSGGDLYTANSPKGIGLIRNQTLISANPDLKVLDAVEAPKGTFWFSGTNGILRIRSNDLKNSIGHPDVPLDFELIDRSDGLNTIECSIGSPDMTVTPDKKLWVATVKGLAMLDLDQLRPASRKPKIFIGSVTVGTNKVLAGGETVLPPGTHHVELHLEAVDLGSPEKVRLQYRLDGVDTGWLDASVSRTAVYTSIPIRSHDFHVRATSSDGVWDREGIVYTITQRPYFYQTPWFLILCAGGLAFLSWEASQYRVRQARARTHLQMEERLSERARIARELHDTLLQSFQGLILNFQRARNLLPRRPEQAMESLDSALERAERAIVEGRDAIHDIRSALTGDDISKELSALGEDLASENRDSSPTFHVVVEGTPKPVRGAVREEIFRVAREALRNAFVHSSASRIEVEISFERRMLRLRIRDDGIGIAETHLGVSGRTGHYGLRGMRERATRIGAQFDMWTQQDAGTEIELRIPEDVAYQVTGNKSSKHVGARLNDR